MVPSEINQKEEDNYWLYTYMWNINKQLSTKTITKTKKVVNRGKREEGGKGRKK